MPEQDPVDHSLILNLKRARKLAPRVTQDDGMMPTYEAGATLGDTSAGSMQSPSEQGKAGGEGFASKARALFACACVS